LDNVIAGNIGKLFPSQLEGGRMTVMSDEGCAKEGNASKQPEKKGKRKKQNRGPTHFYGPCEEDGLPGHLSVAGAGSIDFFSEIV